MSSLHHAELGPGVAPVMSPSALDRVEAALLTHDCQLARDAVVRALRDHAAEVQLVELPGLPEKGDVSDWTAAGGTVEALGVTPAELLATLNGTDLEQPEDGQVEP